MQAMHSNASESQQHAIHAIGNTHCDGVNMAMLMNVPCSESDCFMSNYISGQKMTSLAKTGIEPVAYTGIIAIDPIIATSIITLSPHSPPDGPPIPLDQHITNIVMRT